MGSTAGSGRRRVRQIASAPRATSEWRQDFVDNRILLCHTKSMKITVEISDSDLREICRVTGERKKGPAIRKLVTDALLMKRRERLAQKFISREWCVELKGIEAGPSPAQT